jgi:hypothetical protein
MNVDAENRNNVEQQPVRHTSNRIRNIISINRRCSFCNSNSHTISSCNDTRLNEFESVCLFNKRICDLTNNSRNNFKQWLINYYLDYSDLVKAFAISKCNCTNSYMPDIIVNKIIDYIYYERDIISDYIPFSADLTQDDYDRAMLLLSLQYGENDTTRKFNISTTIKKLDENKSEENCDCAICYGDNLKETNFVTLNCEHKFCKDCLKSSLEHTPLTQEKPHCALCRTEITSILTHDESIKEIFNNIII